MFACITPTKKKKPIVQPISFLFKIDVGSVLSSQGATHVDNLQVCSLTYQPIYLPLALQVLRIASGVRRTFANRT